MIDKNGFRSNVGIILLNDKDQVFWAKRLHQEAWQLPQGGVREKETLESALYRELHEEVGLDPEDVRVLGKTKYWLKYRIPEQFVRQTKPVCVGQKQRWFLLRLCSSDKKIDLNKSGSPEFETWEWVSYFYPMTKVIDFKKGVYRKALLELNALR